MLHFVLPSPKRLKRLLAQLNATPTTWIKLAFEVQSITTLLEDYMRAHELLMKTKVELHNLSVDLQATKHEQRLHCMERDAKYAN